MGIFDFFFGQEKKTEQAGKKAAVKVSTKDCKLCGIESHCSTMNHEMKKTVWKNEDSEPEVNNRYMIFSCGFRHCGTEEQEIRYAESFPRKEASLLNYRELVECPACGAKEETFPKKERQDWLSKMEEDERSKIERCVMSNYMTHYSVYEKKSDPKVYEVWIKDFFEREFSVPDEKSLSKLLECVGLGFERYKDRHVLVLEEITRLYDSFQNHK